LPVVFDASVERGLELCQAEEIGVVEVADVSAPLPSVMTTTAPLTFTPSQSSGSCAVRYTVPATSKVLPVAWPRRTWQLLHALPGCMLAPLPGSAVIMLEQVGGVL
jgi:hypothetical protein